MRRKNITHLLLGRRTFLFRLCLGLVLASLSAGCALRTSASPVSSVPEPETSTPLATPLPSPTPLLAMLSGSPTGEPTSAVPPLQALNPPPSPVPAPLRFTFPTLPADPVTIWRPPLYPTPWEPTPYDHFYFTRPIGANEVNWPLAKYRYGGIFFENTIHTGVDISAPTNTPVMAAGPGTVMWSGFGLTSFTDDPTDPYGLAISIKHDFGYQGQSLYTVYGHLDKAFVIRGQRVESGDVIGLVGETGHATGPHLHFEVRVGDNDYNVSRNPELWLSPPQGWGVMAAQVLKSDGSLLERYIVNIRAYENNQYWYVFTYGGKTVNGDPYYRENMVIGDLPTGKYAVWIEYEGTIYNLDVQIQPGMVAYFRFVGSKGFTATAPPTPIPAFTPPVITTTSTP
ncbi:MAG: peptidoglycan DD-metalloendopeptidase family protein [Chloroflexota bacterium]